MGANCGLGPVRTNMPRRPAGNSPSTSRLRSSRSSQTGAISPCRNGVCQVSVAVIVVPPYEAGTNMAGARNVLRVRIPINTEFGSAT